MKTLLFVIMMIGIGSISAASLAPSIAEVWVQNFGIFENIETLQGIDSPGLKCNCLNAFEPGFDPDDPLTHEYGPEFCLTDPNDQNMVLGDDNMICTWEYHEDYGDAYNEGCSAHFWMKYGKLDSKEYLWPAGYEPDQKYSDVFGTYLTIHADRGVHIGTSQIHYYDDYDNLDPNEDILAPNDDDNLELDYDDLDFVNNLKDAKSHGNTGILLEPTLMDVLRHRNVSPPGGLNALAAESVAAILNAAHREVDYKYDGSDIIDMTSSGIINEQYGMPLTEFRLNNNIGKSELCS